MPVRTYKLAIGHLNRRIILGNDMNCHNCQREIKIGDIVVTKRHRAKQIWHESCATKIGLVD
jgi:hypothetical protein